MNDTTKLCFLVFVVVSIALLIWGFMDMIRKQQVNESSYSEVISRQFRGMGFLILSQFILILGGVFCYGSSEKMFNY